MLARYRKLPQPERGALWSATWRLILVRIILFTGIHQTRKRLGGKKTGLRSQVYPEELALWRLRATALRRAASRMPGVHCLARSLALRWWMRASGLNADSLIGVRSVDGEVESHAWVEVNGRPVDEKTEIVARYQVLKTR